MLALAGAVVFGLALILDWADATVSDAFTPQTLMFLGLLLVALHLGGVGSTLGARTRSRRR
ncbi:MAG: hypothetical protein AVDCRST_MAG41-1622 [uncultured Corynebacteriales bacterium]|uniref:Uncharacterized protein n=1 Tax=uncultured Mycobacteriales bacterium TaxID=581187 RepID=A0A6J4I8N4_9ACTN|nr:MAG: hypothetical protein AVDCRST_MAG41-1622 [uncultured Corynebacteriales bacterium]